MRIEKKLSVERFKEYAATFDDYDHPLPGLGDGVEQVG